jgi:vacuolar protein sorting-associated protein 18
MAYDDAGGYMAGSIPALGDAVLPIFTPELVQLQFTAGSDFVAAQVANNVLILAVSDRVLRIDLDSPADIDGESLSSPLSTHRTPVDFVILDIYLPKKPNEIGVIRKLFLDPSASHLIISTPLGENYYLHTQSRQPKALSRLKGVTIESISWNPLQPTASTREILVGTADGTVYEIFIEPSTEFYRREERYMKAVFKSPEGPITGIWTDTLRNRHDVRRVLISTPGKLYHIAGKLGRHGHEGSGSIFAKLFEAESPTSYDVDKGPPSMLAVSPNPYDGLTMEGDGPDRIFAWLNSQGVLHGPLVKSTDSTDLGTQLFAESSMFPVTQLPHSQTAGGRQRATMEPVSSMLLTQWHIVQLVEGRIVAINRLDGSVTYNESVLDSGQKALGLVADLMKNTFWLFTAREIFEIIVTDESRDVWKIMLKAQKFDQASQYAKTAAEKDAVATASGDYLVGKGQFMEAAAVYGRSTKPFEQVALTFIDNGEQDALRKYLLTRLSTMKKSATMQRIMLGTWLVELFMAKLNVLDDTITTKAELSESMNAADSEDQLSAVRKEFQDFATRHKSDLDRKTTYDIISSHGREGELLFYATIVDDYNYVLAYWIQRERWTESLNVLKKQTDADIFYKYSSVLMINAAVELIDIMMRQPNLNCRKLIPAFLNYNKVVDVPLSQNQAVRYLQFEITQRHSTDAAVHNTLISLYASHPSRDESALLTYLEAQAYAHEQNFDADFALRLCIQHKRVQSCVHIYSNMQQYVQAVDLALKYDEVELASIVADRPESDPALRKKLWLAVAKKVISQSRGIKPALEFLKRCDLLRIEDLIPFFPDFVVIDDFKDEICAALEEYSRQIDELKQEMDESAASAAHVKSDIASLDRRYAIVEPGERCYICRLPLLARQFFVFPCQHAFHSDCLGKKVVEQAGFPRNRRIQELQVEVGKGTSTGSKREQAVKELDALIGSAW